MKDDQTKPTHSARFSGDHDLVRKVQAGETEAFGLLIEKYQNRMFNLALGILKDYDQAMDVTQEAFLKAFSRISSFRFQHRFFSWMYRITINQALSSLKEQKYHMHLDGLQILSREESTSPGQEEIKEIQHAIRQLGEKYQAVLYLKYYQDLSYADIAEIIDLPVKTVRSRLYDARLQLKTQLEKTGYYIH